MNKGVPPNPSSPQLSSDHYQIMGSVSKVSVEVEVNKGVPAIPPLIGGCSQTMESVPILESLLRWVWIKAFPPHPPILVNGPCPLKYPATKKKRWLS